MWPTKENFTTPLSLPAPLLLRTISTSTAMACQRTKLGLPEDEAGLAQAREILHDRVVAICPREQTITLKLVPGHSFARPILYISTDANDPTAAAMEQATFVPALALVPIGGDDSFGSAVERLFAVTNGPSNFDLPDSASVSNHPLFAMDSIPLFVAWIPFNVLGVIPM